MLGVIELISPSGSASKAQVVIFDFDGTLSVIRSGWMDVMVPLCVAQLRSTGTAETDAQLTTVVEEFVWRLTGKETIYQMMALADATRQRGGQPLEPLAYKRMYLEALHQRIDHRLNDLRQGRVAPESYQVPGARQLLQALRDRGLRLYLASGTDHENVKDEAALLGLASFFDDRIYGARDDLSSFSKALLVQQIVSEAGFQGDQLLVFGDGFVEIEEVKKVGGVAVGVATAEPGCQAIDPWKRARLVKVGADFIVPHFLNTAALIDTLFGARIESALPV